MFLSPMHDTWKGTCQCGWHAYVGPITHLTPECETPFSFHSNTNECLDHLVEIAGQPRLCLIAIRLGSLTLSYDGQHYLRSETWL